MIRVDQRSIQFERDDEALREVEARRAGWLEQELGLARLFCRIDRQAAYVTASCGSVQELASRRGYDGPRARDLARLGYALEAEPVLEQLLRDNQIGFPAALALGRIYQHPEFLEPQDAWVRWARFERFADLRRRIRRRVESVRQGRPADIPWRAHVTGRTAENLTRCRQLASRKAGLLLTHGQLLDVLSLSYLLEHDAHGQVQDGPAENESRESRKDENGSAGNGRDAAASGAPQPGTRRRRLPPTGERPHDRTIPAEVVRALEARSGGLCEFGSCERVATESCHLVPHRDGSGREVKDLVRGCRLHHKLFDAGRIEFLGWTESSDPLGCDLPVFLAVETNEILRPKARPGDSAGSGPNPAAECDGLEHPPWLLRSLGTRLRGRLARGLRASSPDARGDAQGTADGHAKGATHEDAQAPEDAHAKGANDGDVRAEADEHAAGARDGDAQANADEHVDRDAHRVDRDAHRVDRDALTGTERSAQPEPTAEPASPQPTCPAPGEASHPPPLPTDTQRDTSGDAPGDGSCDPSGDASGDSPNDAPGDAPGDASQRAPPSAQGP